MQIEMLKSKIHRAKITQAEVDYIGSITLDFDLIEAAGLHEYEKVTIADVTNGNRFETYVIAGEKGSGVVCLNGAAAKCVNVGDYVIIMAYARFEENEIKAGHHPKVVFVDDLNKISLLTHYEKHGRLADLQSDLLSK
jgi:aspartate 1-decarboxylase